VTDRPDTPQQEEEAVTDPEEQTVRIMVTGSREFPIDADGRDQVMRALTGAAELWTGRERVNDVLLTHGDARGLDRLAAQVAAELGWSVKAVPAQWSTHTAACPDWHHGQIRCRMAGHRRNAEMLDAGQDLVVGFPMHPKDSGGSRGTWGAIAGATKRALPVLILSQGRLWLDTASREQDSPLARNYRSYHSLFA